MNSIISGAPGRFCKPACIFILTIFFFFDFMISCTAQLGQQKKRFSRQDSLRGTITPERAWWNVLHYNITVEADYSEKTIRGNTVISFRVSKQASVMQIDLQEPMHIDRITWRKKQLKYKRDGNIYLVQFPQKLKAGTIEMIDIGFSGKPVEAKRPPWDGGWIWSRDKNGSPWMSVACQGLGASVWYPCKDHQSDEPDSASLTMTVPDTLVAIGNGRLRKEKKNGNGTITFTWAVRNPINNYNIIPYIGKYANWNEQYNGEKGKLDLSYWVLDYNIEKSKQQFIQVPKMLRCFEYWFGPYPFYEDGYKLVESPHLGMEHQSAVAYGNKYQNGYLGRDLSGTGWGLKWDFIIIHESGHEWFGNNITSNDLADMWLHEGFTNYSETIFTGCEFGENAATDYVVGIRKGISNDIPIIGEYGVNEEGSGDMYSKGGNMLHTIRMIINDDEKFRNILRGINKTWFHKTVDSKDVEAYISNQSGKKFSKVFDQYLRTTKIPVLEYRINKDELQYRWTNCVPGFDMPVRLFLNGNNILFIFPTEQWKSVIPEMAGKNITSDWAKETFDRNFYITVKKVE